MRALVLLAFLPTVAWAQTALPPLGQISAPGSYYLTADSVSGGTLNLRINVDNVTLDLNGKTVRCQPSDPSTAVTFGIYAISRNNITIRNGRITGCFFGVHASYSNNITLQGIDFSGNTYIGANLCAGGTGCVVRDSLFEGITGYNVEGYAIGLNGGGSNCVVENNRFVNLYKQPGYVGTAPAEGVGILIAAGAAGCTVRGNVFRNDTETENTYAVWLGSTSGASHDIKDNTVVGLQFGIASDSPTSVLADNNVFWIRSQIPGSTVVDAPGGALTGTLACGYSRLVDGGISDGQTQACP